METKVKFTRTAIRYAVPLGNGKWGARKNTNYGCVDFDMVYEDASGLHRTEYDTANQALNARETKLNRWYQ